MRSLRLVAFILCVSSIGLASDHEFRSVVNAIEGHYRVRHMHIPLLGVAMFFARPEGVSGLKLAVFEDFHHADAADVRRVVEDSLGEEWHPFVHVRSRDDAETTLIYARPTDSKFRMLIVNIESDEATVVELSLSERAIKRWMKEPGEEAGGQSGHHRHHAED